MSGYQFSVFVAGEPAPQGSKRYLGTYKDKAGRTRGRMVESSAKVAPWRAAVRDAFTAPDGQPKWRLGDAPIDAYLGFIMPRPKSTPKKKTPPAVKKPDIDKLQRAVFDAIGSAGVWGDDSQLVRVVAAKRIAEIGETPGCSIALRVADGAIGRCWALC